MHPFWNQPVDRAVLRGLSGLQRGALAGILLVAGLVLLGWLWPALADWLPRGWSAMKASTALGLLLALPGLSLGLDEAGTTRRRLALSAALGLLALALPLLLVALWPAAPALAENLRMAPQTAVFLSLLAWVLLLGPPQGQRRLHLGDVLTLALLALVLVVFAGYAYGAVELFGQSFGIATAPQTVICMALATLALIAGRSRAGYFGILSGSDLGSRVARLTLPLALALPFLIIVSSVELSATGWLSPPHASALMSTLAALTLLVGLIALAGRLNAMTGALRQASLTDELTRLHNRRAFYMLGEQAWIATRRNGGVLTMLFLDLDGLKEVNDRLGHEAGSELIRQAAALLRQTFRAADLVARLGGDEFAVLTAVDPGQLDPALQRLEQALSAANARGQAWRIQFSLGRASSREAQDFEAMVALADGRMYADKRARKAAR